MLRSPYPSPSRRASSHEVEHSSTHSTTESRSPRKSESPSSNVAAARGCALTGDRGRITLPMSLGPCVSNSRVCVGSADILTIVVPIEPFSCRRRRRHRGDGGRALGRRERLSEGQLLGRVFPHAPGKRRAIRRHGRDVASGTERRLEPPPILPGVAAMIRAPLLARLMERLAAPAGGAPTGITVLRPAVDLAPVAAATDVEDALAPRASPLPTDLNLVHRRRSNGATVFLPSRSASATVPASGTSRRSDPRGLRLLPGPSSFCHAVAAEPTRAPSPGTSTRPLSSDLGGRLHVASSIQNKGLIRLVEPGRESFPGGIEETREDRDLAAEGSELSDAEVRVLALDALPPHLL